MMENKPEVNKIVAFFKAQGKGTKITIAVIVAIAVGAYFLIPDVKQSVDENILHKNDSTVVDTNVIVQDTVLIGEFDSTAVK